MSDSPITSINAPVNGFSQGGRGGGSIPREFDIFKEARVKLPRTWTPTPVASECEISPSPLKFLTQKTILDVKIPTLVELYDVKFSWVACPLPPWGKPLILGGT